MGILLRFTIITYFGLNIYIIGLSLNKVIFYVDVEFLENIIFKKDRSA